MALASGGGTSEPAARGAGDTSLLTSAATWPLKRYGRFLPPTDSDAEGQNTSSWKVTGGTGRAGCLVLLKLAPVGSKCPLCCKR